MLPPDVLDGGGSLEVGAGGTVTPELVVEVDDDAGAVVDVAEGGVDPFVDDVAPESASEVVVSSPFVVVAASVDEDDVEDSGGVSSLASTRLSRRAPPSDSTLPVKRGSANSVTSSGSTAAAMKLDQISAGNEPPVTSMPWTSSIGRLLLSG